MNTPGSLTPLKNCYHVRISCQMLMKPTECLIGRRDRRSDYSLDRLDHRVLRPNRRRWQRPTRESTFNSVHQVDQQLRRIYTWTSVTLQSCSLVKITFVKERIRSRSVFHIRVGTYLLSMANISIWSQDRRIFI